MERRLAAILAADVVGYTRLMGRDEAGTLRRLTELRQQHLEPLIANHHGRVFKLTGDGFLIAFASVVDALACAAAWQDTVAAEEASTEDDRRFAFRIGINLGDVIVEGDDVHGDGVNIAVRIENLADAGGICLSEDAYRQVRGKIDLTFDDLGEKSLKNVAEPVRVFGVADVTTGAPPVPAMSEALTLPDKPSIAVLAFDNMSADTEQEFFSDGITEDIITELSRFSELFVIARNSSFAYKGRSVDLAQVAEELGVRYILEGSVRRLGHRLRINAQLIDTKTGGHIWAEKYDRQVEDIFELQEEVTRSVVSNIAPQIELAEVERGRAAGGTDVSAYELALKAQGRLYDALHLADSSLLDEAMATADAALNLDPRNTHALWTKGMGYFYPHVYRWGDDPDALLPLANEIANRLVQIDPANAKPYILRAWVSLYDKDFDGAIADHRRALALNPNLASNLFAMAWSESAAGLADDARQHAQMALRLSPRDNYTWLGEGYGAMGLASFTEGDFDQALAWLRQSIQMHARMPVCQALMIATSAYLGNMDAANQHAAFLDGFAPKFVPGVLAGRIEVCKLPEHNALLIEGLRKAGL
ncbi:MAG: adenylate/guanylate cyclase domain-containing protein [Pseudomonadota bacterium]